MVTHLDFLMLPASPWSVDPFPTGSSIPPTLLLSSVPPAQSLSSYSWALLTLVLPLGPLWLLASPWSHPPPAPPYSPLPALLWWFLVHSVSAAHLTVVAVRS